MRVYLGDATPYEALRRTVARHGEDIAAHLDLHLQLAIHADHVDELQNAPGSWVWQDGGTIQSRIGGLLTVTWEARDDDGDPTTDPDAVTALLLSSVAKEGPPMSQTDA